MALHAQEVKPINFLLGLNWMDWIYCMEQKGEPPFACHSERSEESQEAQDKLRPADEKYNELYKFD